MRKIPYTIDEIKNVYEKLVRYAEQTNEQGNYKRTALVIQRCACMEYLINDRYSDYRLNNLLKQISNKIVSPPNYDYTTNPKRILFYGGDVIDNQGLTMQYLDAIISLGKYEVLFLNESSFNSTNQKIYNYLKTKGIETVEICDQRWEDKICHIAQVVYDFAPGMILFHLWPWSTLPFISLYSHPSIKFQINLTDHAYWLGGSDFFNYSFEFRNYGRTVSVEKRGFNDRQLLRLPFYPWIEKTDFKGFPEELKGKKILFTGGALYKISGENNLFLNIVKNILSNNNNVVFVFAGGGNPSQLWEFVKNDPIMSGRTYYLGFRDDIEEVMKRSDVYLDTYPFGGGLMVQIAATNSKPILVYKDTDVENLVGTKKKSKFVFNKIEDLIREANHLFCDETYYRERSLFFKSLISDRIDFVNSFKGCLDNHKTFAEPLDSIDYIGFTNQYLERMNSGYNRTDFESLAFRTCPTSLSLKMYFNLIMGLKYEIGKILRKK